MPTQEGTWGQRDTAGGLRPRGTVSVLGPSLTHGAEMLEFRYQKSQEELNLKSNKSLQTWEATREMR